MCSREQQPGLTQEFLRNAEPKTQTYGIRSAFSHNPQDMQVHTEI